MWFCCRITKSWPALVTLVDSQGSQPLNRLSDVIKSHVLFYYCEWHIQKNFPLPLCLSLSLSLSSSSPPATPLLTYLKEGNVEQTEIRQDSVKNKARKGYMIFLIMHTPPPILKGYYHSLLNHPWKICMPKAKNSTPPVGRGPTQT